MNLLENVGVFIDADDNDARAVDLASESAAVDWVTNGPGGAITASVAAPPASGGTTLSSVGGIIATASATIKTTGRLAGASRVLISGTGARKIAVMSYGAMGYFRQNIGQLVGQANHLAQNAIFERLGIPKEAGLAINLKGFAGVSGTAHWAFHKYLDDWFDRIRSGVEAIPSVRAYNKKMVEALEQAGIDSRKANEIRILVEKQQSFYGIRLTQDIVSNIAEIPHRVTQSG
jgi:hypothetical protein